VHNCDTYSFFNKGYSQGILDPTLYLKFKDFLYNAKFIGDNKFGVHEFAYWNNLAHESDIIRDKYLKSKVPLELVTLAHEFIRSSYFDSYRTKIACVESLEDSWIKHIEPIAYQCFQGHEINTGEPAVTNWHTDCSDASDFFVLMYFNTSDSFASGWDHSWGGSLEVGKVLETNEVQSYVEVFPDNGNFVMLNNTNPYLKHKVNPIKDFNIGTKRQVISIYYKVV